ncbi:GntR family transcriptional regulator [Pseudactinotalea sp. Z1739]|uniref:GntR family transcriptional regulator n=1 Tax=Pseudactinotalea sp. Z1739 TaxID=3413028 RepID=UPI003C7CAE07
MLIRVDQSSETPLFEQVAASVRAGAAAGRIRPGERLPSAREVAAALDVNLHTVLKAYQDLRDEGLVTMRRGRGAVLTEAAGHLAQIHRDVLDLVERARALGLSTETLASIVKELSDDR